ncbi:3-oxoacyl-[acyl-carrier-protein] synthase, KASII [hydrothermal vent metagenome]|uniref:3-oxoacyl-[acyl-carrier-protein] synthase, KASII n=1 Tax=hydrothermal vent metagenome TaxID=652676 RepID=A0A3B0YLZ2_9ZZZZ
MNCNQAPTRVVVTGMGMVTPLGSNLDAFSHLLLNGQSAANKISIFDPAQLPTQIAAEVTDFTPIKEFPDRKVSFAVSAAKAAIIDADKTVLKDADKDGTAILHYYKNLRSQLSIGIGLELFSMPDMLDYLNHSEVATDSHSLSHIQTPSDICAHLISDEFNLNRPPLIHVSACAASTDALGSAFRALRSDHCDWMLAGGTDSMINPLGVGGFSKLQALTRRNSAPEQASRPFDRDRDGFLLGEGAGFLVLEKLQNALQRGASIYGEIVGFANSFDAHGISEPHPQGDGAYLAMRKAIADAQLSPELIAHISAHGTSTPKNDIIETKAIHRLFKKAASNISVNATKSMIGHLISASGVVEVGALLACASKGALHPSINIDHADNLCDLDYISEGQRAFTGGYCLKNSFGFGGQNSSLVLKI